MFINTRLLLSIVGVVLLSLAAVGCENKAAEVYSKNAKGDKGKDGTPKGVEAPPPARDHDNGNQNSQNGPDPKDCVLSTGESKQKPSGECKLIDLGLHPFNLKFSGTANQQTQWKSGKYALQKGALSKWIDPKQPYCTCLVQKGPNGVDDRVEVEDTEIKLVTEWVHEDDANLLTKQGPVASYSFGGFTEPKGSEGGKGDKRMALMMVSKDQTQGVLCVRPASQGRFLKKDLDQVAGTFLLMVAP